MTIDARVVRIHGDDIDTDVLYPGPFLDIEDPELMKDHLFEGLDPALRDRLGGDTALVVDANFTVMPRDKVGIVGRNGAGKTSLFKVLGGAVEPAAGRVVRRGGFGYLPQDPRI